MVDGLEAGVAEAPLMAIALQQRHAALWQILSDSLSMQSS